MIRRWLYRCLASVYPLTAHLGERRGIERAAEWHDSLADLADVSDQAAVAAWHHDAATRLRRL
jgi:hypothetical protein